MIGTVPTNRASNLEAFLLQEARHHLLSLGLLIRHGPSSFLACIDDGEFMGVAYVGEDGVVVPAGIKNTDAALELGGALKEKNIRIIMGETSIVGNILRGLEAPRIKGQSGRLCTATPDDMGPYITPALRPATEKDIPALLELNASYYSEMNLLPPPQGLEIPVTARVKAMDTWVIKQDGRIAFRVDIAAKSNHGAHVDIVYTIPEYRGRGLAATGLGQLSRSTLARLPCLSALVPTQNPAAAAVVRKVGFGPALSWRMVDLRIKGTERRNSSETAA